MKKILINASNLHVGGGVQVATSVIGELTSMSSIPGDLVVWASDEVDVNLRKLGYNLSTLPTYEVVNSYGLRLLLSPLFRRFQQFRTVFTVFGPLYVWKLSGVNITGFAQPWIIYPNNEIEREMVWYQRWFIRFKFFFQTFFFRRADKLVVELDHVRRGLVDRNISSMSSIDVVHNCLSSLYMSPSTWKPVCVVDAGADIKLGFLGRNYSHKNTRVFPELIAILRSYHGIRASIYVTFTEDEWAACDDEFRTTISNVGPLFVAQCPTFYNSIDAVIFPSLLECFSATPLEAMVMEKPFFASDRPFNRDVCLGHAHYFDPLSPASAAQAIARVYLNGGPSRDDLRAAREHALNFSNPRVRAKKYLDLLIQKYNNLND
jgi:glycosyltransferase involved in cell wall biosynthesis